MFATLHGGSGVSTDNSFVVARKVAMLTVKLFAGIAGALVAGIIFCNLHHLPPVPIYLQLLLALFCLIFGATYFIAELWIRPFV